MARTKFRITAPVDYKPLGNLFARLRREAGHKQSTVASHTGISESQIGRIEKGVGLDRVSFEDIIRLCRYHNVTPTRAAEIMGIWPVAEVAEVETDERIRSLPARIAQMPIEKRKIFIEMIYQAASTLANREGEE